MAISIFPSTAAEFVSNNFVIDMNDTSNNTADTGGVKQAGPYSMSFSSGDSSFDVYLIDEDGNSVGYSNNTSIVASGLFTTVVILGVAQDEVVSFLYQGSVNNADGEGDEPGAGAYLESISPSDLPTIDDTATVTGGNFASDVEITFESGATVLSAKNIVVNSSTELLVTRPDGLIEDNSPYDLKAVNPGVTPPTGTDGHILTDEVTAGSDPTWVTGANLLAGELNVTYVGVTLEATDDVTVTDYSVTSGSLPTGLSLNSTTGVISGTPTASGQVFTVTATDDGGNTSSKEFSLPVQASTGGTITTDTGAIVHTFDSTDDFIAQTDIANASFVLIGGGGGADSGGGGGGGIVSTFAPDTGSGASVTITAGSHTATIGAGGIGSRAVGGNTSFGSFGTALGGGGGGALGGTGGDGGAGGGGGGQASGGTGSNGGDGGDGTVAGGNFNTGGSGGGGGPEGTDGGDSFGAPGIGTITTIRGSSERFSDGGPNKFGGKAFTTFTNQTGGSGAVIVRYI